MMLPVQRIDLQIRKYSKWSLSRFSISKLNKITNGDDYL